MKHFIYLATFFSLFLISDSFAADSFISSTLEDQSDVALTVYNSNLALVKDQRNVNFSDKTGELHFMDVASFIMPETVHVRSLDDAKSLQVLEQNYEYDLMSQEKVLDKYVGKKIKLVTWNEDRDRQSLVEATVLSSEAQIFKINEEIYLGHPGHKIVPEIPNNLISRPTLTWFYENTGKPEQKIEVSYLTSNIGWKADYVAVLGGDDKTMDLSGWVTLDNKSGATYEQARLKLVAGNVNRVEQPYLQEKVYAARAMMVADVAAPQFQEKSFFEYHIYDLQRRTTIKNNQTKQINLLEASGIKAVKEYRVNAQTYFYQSQYSQDPKQAINVFITFLNKKENNLGMPLPAGTIRLYKKDTDGSEQFAGEDSISHTPEGEKVRLRVGEAFDLVCERKQTDYRITSDRTHESEWEITLKNRKEEDVVISLVEPFSSQWKIISSSHPHQKEDAFSARFNIPVAKKSEVVLKYRVSIKY